MENNQFDTSYITANDSQLLDIYSSTVTGVVRNTAQAVVHIKVIRKVTNPQTRQAVELPGSGSGFVI